MGIARVGLAQLRKDMLLRLRGLGGVSDALDGIPPICEGVALFRLHGDNIEYIHGFFPVPSPLLMHGTNFSAFCLGGWGDSRSGVGLCRSGYLQHPRSLECVDGVLNLATPPAIVDADSDKGWWCAKPDIGDLLEFDKLPPFYFIFVTGLLKLMFSIVAFGPPKAGLAKDATTLVEKGKVVAKRFLQSAILIMAIGAFVADMTEAWVFANAVLAPAAIEGYPTIFFPWLACAVRFYGAASLVLCKSGINSTASVDSLKALYRGHYQMEYAHEGERILRKREAEKNPVPVEMRHGLQNAYALAGHEDFEGDMTELMYQKEGIIMRIYITFVNKVLSPIYVTLTLPWMFVGTLAYMPIV
eukprot:CAMPEP_0180624914 /NCGR_PEP_ID=MMETSP1037_2-20121125/37029_1 /TAXON_ID=632150 /ORGANISM="Azadinium spinosum, Strain 3D9" /LENGTH=356 /DNA_ID=CAMNT_0022645375 /DNA_START=444 /DNA_END=1511 /DNA_ORIENTATION=+